MQLCGAIILQKFIAFSFWKQAARLYFEEEFNRPKDSYSKVAICGRDWLYAASPIYRLDDYNTEIFNKKPLKARNEKLQRFTQTNKTHRHYLE